METVVLRSVTDEDIPFILSTWLRGLRSGNSWFKEIDSKSYFNFYQSVIGRLIRSSRVDVAVLADDPDTIIGYIVYSEHVLHWIHVRGRWRKLGVGKMLVPKGITRVSHLTKLGLRLKPQHWSFDPFI